MTATTQSAMILRDLRRGKRITSLDAMRTYGCMRLGARIFELKRKGIPIKSERITDRRTRKSFSQYRLAR